MFPFSESGYPFFLLWILQSIKRAPVPSTTGGWRTTCSSPSPPTRPRRSRDDKSASSTDQACRTCAHPKRRAHAQPRVSRLPSDAQLRSAFRLLLPCQRQHANAQKPACWPKLSLNPPPRERAPAATRKKRARDAQLRPEAHKRLLPSLLLLVTLRLRARVELRLGCERTAKQNNANTHAKPRKAMQKPRKAMSNPCRHMQEAQTKPTHIARPNI